MTERHSPLVRPLGDLSATDLAVAGGKGANLGELLRAGFPVPDGFVVTTAAYDAFVAAGDLDAHLDQLSSGPDAETAIAALFASAELPPEIAAAITTAYDELGGGPVAVRSSATAEDLPGASFAGQQDTYLNIAGAEAVLGAVRRCWASLWNTRAIAYREQARHDADAALSIAVVVQRLVPAEVAGVMFTANPGNGRREQTVITAAWGLGEAVVGGLVEPDEYVFDRSHPDAVQRRIAAKKVMTVGVPGGSDQTETPASQVDAATLTDAQVRELAVLGGRIEEHFGTPQDIEWALAGGTFHIVQARPITALPDPVGDVPTDWPLPHPRGLYFRASIVEQLPDPLTPLFADLIRDAVPIGLDRLLAGFNPDLAGLDVRFPTINGYAYYEYSRSAMARMSALTPVAGVMLTQKGFVLGRWRDHALPDYRAAVAGWADRDPAALPASELLAGVRELLTAGCSYYGNVQMVIPVAATTELTWTGLYDAVLRRPGDPQASDFLLGFDSAPLLAEKSLHALAVWCRDVPGLAEVLAATPAQGIPGSAGTQSQVPARDVLAAAPPSGVEPGDWAAFTGRLREHLDEFGHTIYNLDFANPVPADDPTPVVQALKHAIAGRGTDPDQRQRDAVARRELITGELLGRLDPVRKTAAKRSLAAAQTWAPIREDALAAMGLAWPTLRRLLRELGTRLTRVGAIDTPDDVFWLTAAEADAAAAALDVALNADASDTPAPDVLDPGDSIPGTNAVARAAGPHGTAGRGTSAPGIRYGSPHPDHRAAIEERRMVWRGRKLATPPQYLPVSRVMSMMDSMMPARDDNQSGPVLKGTGGSGGRVTAPARVLAGAEDFAAFQPGEILVASITTPAYTPLFALASGVVTDIGGVLSHGSIVAREYGIPAVLGTGNATKRITTGDVITVDGGSGTVHLEGAPVLADEGPAEGAPTGPHIPSWAWVAAASAAAAGALVLARHRRHRLEPLPG